MAIKKSKKKLILLLISIFLVSILSLLGGIKLMFYIFLLITGAFLGWQLKKVFIVLQDYRLALKINTVQFNAKETDILKTKLADLQAELKSAETRLNLKEVK